MQLINIFDHCDITVSTATEILSFSVCYLFSRSTNCNLLYHETVPNNNFGNSHLQQLKEWL